MYDAHSGKMKFLQVFGHCEAVDYAVVEVFVASPRHFTVHKHVCRFAEHHLIFRRIGSAGGAPRMVDPYQIIVVIRYPAASRVVRIQHVFIAYKTHLNRFVRRSHVDDTLEYGFLIMGIYRVVPFSP
ncbi:hypothetical protein SDC9_205931 [bioreactor metagenome]|uniref:Uncharacterized protein n=1 Tax=bioreactor metagenome TaxID=1076179 RepID=A0A645J3K0_9ZZZZ